MGVDVLLDITLPEIEQIATEPDHARFKMEPLEPGWGTTLGNALKKVLLNSLPGAAVTAIKLDPPPDDEGRIPQIEEDIIDLILNAKQLRLRYRGEQPQRMILHTGTFANGRRVLTAGDAELADGLELLNPEVELLTISNASRDPLNVELMIERGYGYSPAEAHMDSTPLDMVPIDAMYSPISRVNYVVEHTRLGQRTDYDRLILDIWTDGTIEAVEALRQAAQILTKHGQIIASFSGGLFDLAEEVELPAPPVNTELARVPIDSLDLSSRTFNALKRAYIDTVGQVMTMGDNELLALRNFGQKALDELHEKLQAKGFEGGGVATAPSASGLLPGHPTTAEPEVDEDKGRKGKKEKPGKGTRLTSLSDLAALADLDDEDEDEELSSHPLPLAVGGEIKHEPIATYG